MVLLDEQGDFCTPQNDRLSALIGQALNDADIDLSGFWTHNAKA